MKNGETVSIILIEDDDGHATLVQRNLRRAGISNGFLRFADGQQALDYLAIRQAGTWPANTRRVRI
jgi:predicted O-methyltransferase YrrM